MISKTLWNADVTYRIAGDTPDDGRSLEFMLVSSDDIAEVACVILHRVREHADDNHGEDSLADVVTHTVDRIGEVWLEGEGDE